MRLDCLLFREQLFATNVVVLVSIRLPRGIRQKCFHKSLLQKQPSTTIGCKSPALRLRREIVLNVATATPAAISLPHPCSELFRSIS